MAGDDEIVAEPAAPLNRQGDARNSSRSCGADCQTELARQTMRAEEEQRKRVEDRQRTQTSVKESLEQLDGIIRAWSHSKDLERFFQGVEGQASRLDVVEREPVLSRLALA